jgi:hypothetical protein
MRLIVKSQLYTDKEARQGILDDCAPSALAAAVAYASGYAINPTAAEGVAAKAKATKQRDTQGKSDNGSSLPQMVQTAKVFGAKARYPKSWADAMAAAKSQAALLLWVQAPIGFPPMALSKWAMKHKAYWKKQGQPNRTYGHMVCVAWSQEFSWQLADPTMDERKAAERYGFRITEADVLAMAKGKPGPAHKHLLIITHPGAPAKPAPTPAAPAKPALAAPAAIPVQADLRAVEPRQVAASGNVPPAPAKPARAAINVELPDLSKVQWGQALDRAGSAITQAADAAGKETGMMRKITAAIKWIITHTQLDNALIDALRSGLMVAISVSLSMGIPLLDLGAQDFRVIGSAALAAVLQTIVRFIDPDMKAFGLTKKS